MLRFLGFTQVAFFSLLSHKLRSLLSILGIVCGVLAVMAMISTGEGAKQKVLAELAGLGLNNIYIHQAPKNHNPGRVLEGTKSYGLTWNDIHRLKKQSFVESVAGLKEIEIVPFGIDKDISAKVVYASAEYKDIAGRKLREGRYIIGEDSNQNNLVCVLGDKVAKLLGVAGRIGAHLRLGDQLYKVVGILENTENVNTEVKKITSDNTNEMVFLSFPFSVMSRDDSLKSSLSSDLSQIIVKVAQGVDVITASQAIDRLLYINHHEVHDYSMLVPRQLLNQSMKTQAVFNLFLAVTGGISLFVGGIGIMNIMLANVSERKREIGIRRAVGATKQDIVFQFLTESVLLTVTGGLVGLFLGSIAVICIELLAGWAVKVTVLSMLLPFGLAVFAGIFFGIYPAIQAANLEPIKALKSL
jgi:putative ABC transport system permease protein